MKATETGTDKVKKICDVLRRETLDPAKEEATAIIDKARAEAKQLIAEAKREAKNMHEQAKKKIEEERELFQASIHVACKKSLGLLKEEIEEKLFNRELKTFLEKPLSDPKLIAKLIEAIVTAIEREGLDAELSAIIPKSVPAEEVNQSLAANILQKLAKKSVELGEITGGAKVKLKEKHLTIDISESAVQNLLAHYVREDFRSIVFHAG
ncbi:MAG: V-type ATP synthase subunit E [Chlamydiota bacterium]